jgi:UMF1 family MFS transporter
VTLATILAAIVLMFVGAVADRSPRPARLLGLFAWSGAAAAAAMFFVAGDNWQLGVLLMVLATVAFASSQAVYDSLLCRIAAPDDRDAVSSRGWGLGYLGGGLLLALNLAFITMGDSLGIDQGMAARISML